MSGPRFHFSALRTNLEDIISKLSSNAAAQEKKEYIDFVFRGPEARERLTRKRLTEELIKKFAGEMSDEARTSLLTVLTSVKRMEEFLGVAAKAWTQSLSDREIGQAFEGPMSPEQKQQWASERAKALKSVDIYTAILAERAPAPVNKLTA